MTTFEIIVAVAIIVIVGLKILEFTGMATTYVKMKEGFECLAKKVEWCDDKLDLIKFAALDISNQLNNIEDNILDVCKQQQGAWACDVTTIVKGVNELTDIVDKMHRNLCVEIADKMVNKMYPVNEGESLDAPFEPDYKLKKDIENKLNGFAAAVLDAECCPQEILDLWTERICESAHKFIKQFKIDWDKLSKEQQDEFLKRLILPNYDKPFVPPFNPTCETTNKED